MNEEPISTIHVWLVEERGARMWFPAGTVRTWTRNHALACRKAREGTPAYNQGVRFKVTHARTEVPPDGMLLVEKNPANVSWKVVDVYGELAALARENKRRRSQ